MGVAAFGVVGGYHIGCHGLSKAAWTGDTYKTIFRIQLLVKNSNKQRLINIVTTFFQILEISENQGLHMFPCIAPQNKYNTILPIMQILSIMYRKSESREKYKRQNSSLKRTDRVSRGLYPTYSEYSSMV